MINFRYKNNNMKRIILVFIGLFSLAYAQTSKTGAKTFFVNGLWMGTKLDSYFNSADSNAIYWRADSLVMAKYKGTARALSFRDDTSFLTNRFVRLQTGNLYRQDGKMWISDTIRTSGVVMAGSHLRSDSIRTSGLLRVSSGLTTPNNTGYSIRATTGVSINMVGVSTLDTGLLGSVAVPVTIRGVDQIRFSNTTTGARQELPNASGTIALTSNVTDSAAALRASINTKLNISDTAAMKATITLDRVLQNGNTTGRTITADAFQGKVQTATTTTNANFSIGIFATNANQNQVVNVTNAATINPSTGAFGVGSGGISTSGNLTVSGFTYPQDVSLAKGVSFINGGQPSVIANSTAMYVERSGVTTDLIVRTDTSVSPFTLRKYLRFNNSTTNTYTFPNNTGTLALTTDTSFSTVTFDRVLANGNTTGRTFTAGGATLTGALSGTSGTFTVADGTAGFRVAGASGRLKQWGYFDATFGGVVEAVAANDAILIPITIQGSKVLLSGGNVGIGTTSPLATLSIGAGSFTDALLPVQINAGAASQAYFAANNNGTYGLLMGYDNNNGYARIRNVSNTALTFETNNLERGRLVSAGRWLFGTTTDDGSSIIQANGRVTVANLVIGGNSSGSAFFSASSGVNTANPDATSHGNDFMGGAGWWAFRTNATTKAFNLDMYNSASPLTALTITQAGAATFSSSVTANSFIKSGGTSSQYLMADGSTSTLTTGSLVGSTYTPTLTSITNIASSGAVLTMYQRVGEIVTVSGYFVMACTSTGNFQIDMSLPVASNFTSVNNASLFGNADTNDLSFVRGQADTTNDRVSIYGTANTTSSTNVRFTFTYRVL